MEDHIIFSNFLA